MDEKLRAHLNSVLAKDTEIRDAEHENQQSRAQKAQTALKSWKELYQNTLLPGLNELMTTLRKAGWFADTENMSTGFKVKVYKGDMQVHHTRERPFVSFTMQDGYPNVLVHAGTPSSSGTGSADEEKPLKEVTLEFVEEQIVALVTALAKK